MFNFINDYIIGRIQNILIIIVFELVFPNQNFTLVLTNNSYVFITVPDLSRLIYN